MSTTVQNIISSYYLLHLITFWGKNKTFPLLQQKNSLLFDMRMKLQTRRDECVERSVGFSNSQTVALAPNC